MKMRFGKARNEPCREIKVELTKTPKTETARNETKLGFGKIFTDHMFIMNYDEGEGWHDPRIVPYGPISLEPSAMCLHYGQSVFEGMKGLPYGGRPDPAVPPGEEYGAAECFQ